MVTPITIFHHLGVHIVHIGIIFMILMLFLVTMRRTWEWKRPTAGLLFSATASQLPTLSSSISWSSWIGMISTKWMKLTTLKYVWALNDILYLQFRPHKRKRSVCCQIIFICFMMCFTEYYYWLNISCCSMTDPYQELCSYYPQLETVQTISYFSFWRNALPYNLYFIFWRNVLPYDLYFIFWRNVLSYNLKIRQKVHQTVSWRNWKHSDLQQLLILDPLQTWNNFFSWQSRSHHRWLSWWWQQYNNYGDSDGSGDDYGDGVGDLRLDNRFQHKFVPVVQFDFISRLHIFDI